MKVIICGALGKMGAKIKELLPEDLSPLCGVDVKDAAAGVMPVYDSFSKITEKADVIIDFSSPKSLPALLEYAIRTNTPAVLCSTGYTEKDIADIESASEKVALFRSANMSLGVNVLIEAVKLCAERLEGFDIEIIEKHHNRKKDAPSGTAVMLKDAVIEVLPNDYPVYGRQGIVGARDKREIGIHAVRGGTMVGEHQVIFAGENETVTLTHQAESREVFAKGAILAARYISGKKHGLFAMKDLLENR